VVSSSRVLLESGVEAGNRKERKLPGTESRKQSVKSDQYNASPRPRCARISRGEGILRGREKNETKEGKRGREP